MGIIFGRARFPRKATIVNRLGFLYLVEVGIHLLIPGAGRVVAVEHLGIYNNFQGRYGNRQVRIEQYITFMYFYNWEFHLTAECDLRLIRIVMYRECGLKLPLSTLIHIWTGS
jgi:hypothetical protein